MKFKQAILFAGLFMFRMVLHSQNYVANASFENISSCPDDFFQIYKSPPWFSPDCEPLRPDRHGYAILFTSRAPCFSDLTGVPKNVWCYQDAHSGFSYAGIEILSANTIESTYRQYMETKLQLPLEAGKKYYVSLFYNLCYGQTVSPDIICFKTDSLGAYFSENIIDKNPNCHPLPVPPQVHDEGKQISPGQGWRELSGCITAKGNEQYMTIGNFADNVFSNCSSVDSIGYYVLIDDVAVIPEIAKQIDSVVCDGKDLTINADQLRNEYLYLGGWKYQWSDGNTDITRKFTSPGNYTLNVMNKDCFTDVYNFKIGFGECKCKDYIPNTFTPNGDNLNDTFIPHLICQSRQISGYKFSIFNRWGERIFFTTSETLAWDGTYKGQKVQTGEYVYLVQYKTGASDEINTVKGTVLVLR
ncbi:MAG: gliding motility-associated C-terminal domain-containing protein [Bacteroidota bacterium]